jgi:hypothetical protein
MTQRQYEMKATDKDDKKDGIHSKPKLAQRQPSCIPLTTFCRLLISAHDSDGTFPAAPASTVLLFYAAAVTIKRLRRSVVSHVQKSPQRELGLEHVHPTHRNSLALTKSIFFILSEGSAERMIHSEVVDEGGRVICSAQGLGTIDRL